MKGIVLAGGTGSRLHPLAAVTNKYLLPVGNYSMVFHSIARLRQGGITDILLVTGRDHPGDVLGPGSSCSCCWEGQPCISLKGGLVALNVQSQEDGDGNR